MYNLLFPLCIERVDFEEGAVNALCKAVFLWCVRDCGVVDYVVGCVEAGLEAFPMLKSICSYFVIDFNNGNRKRFYYL